MFSGLSPGVTRARYFDQAARNVACIAEVLKRAGTKPAEHMRLGFYVVAPEAQIRSGVFAQLMTKDSIGAKVDRRVREHDEPPVEWYEEWFLSTLEAIELGEISRESPAGFMTQADAEYGAELGRFYEKCLDFNDVKRSA